MNTPVVEENQAQDVLNPSGICMCGCGQETPIARYHRKQDGIAKGQHVRYIKGHWARTQQKQIPPPNPSGLCVCGCGAQTPLATRNRPDKGIVKGQPLRYVPGHARRGRKPPPADPGPNPSGFCMCGCGQKTSLAPVSDVKRFKVRGRPMRYLKGHHNRGVSRPLSGRRLALVEASHKRHREVIAAYMAGEKMDDIAAQFGLAGAPSVAWMVSRWRERGMEIPRRNAEYRDPTDTETIERVRRMWLRGIPSAEIQATFGWTPHQLRLLRRTLALKREPELAKDDIRRVRRLARKVKVPETPGRLTDRRRTLLRLIAACEKPVSASALADLCCALGDFGTAQYTLHALRDMRRLGMVERVAGERVHRHRSTWLWFVPTGSQQPEGALTLADAERETELAKLIREQEQELARGAFASSTGAVSLDAPLDDDGTSWYEILSDDRYVD